MQNPIDYTKLDTDTIASIITNKFDNDDDRARVILGMANPNEHDPKSYNLKGIAHEVAQAVTNHDNTPAHLMSPSARAQAEQVARQALDQAIRNHYHGNA